MVVMAGGRLRGRGFDSPIGTFFFTPFLSFFFLSRFFPSCFSFMLAPPFQCSSIFLVFTIMVKHNALNLGDRVHNMRRDLRSPEVECNASDLL